MRATTKKLAAGPFLCGSLLALLGAAKTDGSFREVSFETRDQGRVYGNLYGEGGRAVVLAHGAVFNKESWDPLAKRLAKEGFRVLAIDFRGYGKSKAGKDEKALYYDVLAAVKYLRDAGARSVSVIGGSMGGGACAQAAVESEPDEIDRVILLAPVPIASPERIKGRKLFVVGEGDGLRRQVEQQCAKAPEPKKLVTLKGDAHAQHIFKTDQAEALTTLILDWLNDPKKPA